MNIRDDRIWIKKNGVNVVRPNKQRVHLPISDETRKLIKDLNTANKNFCNELSLEKKAGVGG